VGKVALLHWLTKHNIFAMLWYNTVLRWQDASFLPDMQVKITHAEEGQSLQRQGGEKATLGMPE
jgi:hypothetical protein